MKDGDDSNFQLSPSPMQLSLEHWEPEDHQVDG